MPELIVLGIAILAIMFTWNKMYLPTVLDDTRDKIFDLRDKKVKDFFLATPEGLNHPMYTTLRSLLNAHLRYTEDLTFIQFIIALAVGDKQRREFEKTGFKPKDPFATHDKKLAEFVSQTRNDALLIMFDHMTKTSPLAWLFAMLGLVFFAIAGVISLWRRLHHTAQSSHKVVAKYALCGGLFMTFASTIGWGYTAKFQMEQNALHNQSSTGLS